MTLRDLQMGELKDAFDELFNSTNDISVDDTDKELESPTLLLNLDEINGAAKSQAQEITERLSNYYFDERYLEEHPYIKNKIAQEIENIRRLLKMISINEAAQDALITNITSNAGKGSLYQSLTATSNTYYNDARIDVYVNDTPIVEGIELKTDVVENILDKINFPIKLSNNDTLTFYAYWIGSHSSVTFNLNGSGYIFY